MLFLLINFSFKRYLICFIEILIIKTVL